MKRSNAVCILALGIMVLGTILGCIPLADSPQGTTTGRFYQGTLVLPNMF